MVFFSPYFFPQIIPNAYLLLRHRYSLMVSYLLMRKAMVYMKYINILSKLSSFHATHFIILTTYLPLIPSCWQLFSRLSNSLFATTHLCWLLKWLTEFVFLG